MNDNSMSKVFTAIVVMGSLLVGVLYAISIVTSDGGDVAGASSVQYRR